MNCRFCNKELMQLFVSLGTAPMSNAYLKKEQLCKRESFYPLDCNVNSDEDLQNYIKDAKGKNIIWGRA